MKLFLAMLLGFVMAMMAPGKTYANNENNPHVSTIELGSITAAGDVYGLYLPKRAKVLGMWVVDSTGIAASDSNYVQISLQSGSTVIAELDSRAAHENALVANVPKAGNVVESAALLPAGTYLKVSYAETGTVGMTTAKVFVLWSSQ